MQPGNAKVPRLGRNRSLRVLYDEACEDVQEVRQQARHHGDCDGENSRSVTPAREEAQDDDYSGYDGADGVEIRGFDDGDHAVCARNVRCQREILDYRQELLHYANFKMHFGMSDETRGFMEDFRDVMTSCTAAVDPMATSMILLFVGVVALPTAWAACECDSTIPFDSSLCPYDSECQSTGYKFTAKEEGDKCVGVVECDSPAKVNMRMKNGVSLWDVTSESLNTPYSIYCKDRKWMLDFFVIHKQELSGIACAGPKAT